MKRFLTLTYSTWFGSGLSPFAPGTAGTAAAIPFAFFLSFAADRWMPGLGAWNPGNLLGALVLFYPGVVAATRTEEYIGKHDPGMVVIDEVVGLFLTLAFLGTVFHYFLGTYVWAFFVFRILDVWKPGLIDRAQLLPRGWGVMVDDVLAGLVGGLFLLALSLLWPASMTWGDLTPWLNKLLYMWGA